MEFYANEDYNLPTQYSQMSLNHEPIDGLEETSEKFSEKFPAKVEEKIQEKAMEEDFDGVPYEGSSQNSLDSQSFHWTNPIPSKSELKL